MIKNQLNQDKRKYEFLVKNYAKKLKPHKILKYSLGIINVVFCSKYVVSI